MSPELETLDQLQGGDMPLAVVRQVYLEDDRFVVGMLGLLRAGEILLTENAVEVPRWRWKEVLTGDFTGVQVKLTKDGAARIA